MTFANNEKKLATASEDRSVKIWNLAGYESNVAEHTFSFPKIFTCLEYCENDAFLASGHQDGVVRMWNLSQGNKPMHEISAHEDTVTCVRSYGQGKYLLTCGKDSKLSIIDTRMTSEPVAILEDDELVVTNNVEISLSHFGSGS